MATWEEFAQASPELARFGFERLNGKVAYLATVRKSGSPRVHPVTPIIGGGHLFLFMEPTSPKGYDIRRDGSYAMHSLVTSSEGEEGEFSLNGWGVLLEEPRLRAVATKASSYPVEDRYVLFELCVESAMSTVYDDDGPVRTHWRNE